MTAQLVHEVERGGTPPGWGVWADLTPPELVRSRRLGVVRRLIAMGLVGVVLVLAAVYALALLRQSHASDAMADQESRTATLQAQQQRYASVTAMQNSVAQVRGQLAQLMAGDVQFRGPISAIRAGLPVGAQLTQAQVTVSATAAGTAASATSGSGVSLDTSGHAAIGSVTLTGTARTLVDVASYVSALQKLTGVVEVIPASNALTGSSYAFSIDLVITDQLLSRAWTAGSTAGSTATSTGSAT